MSFPLRLISLVRKLRVTTNGSLCIVCSETNELLTGRNVPAPTCRHTFSISIPFAAIESSTLSAPSTVLCETGLQLPWPVGPSPSPCSLPPQGVSSTRNPSPSPLCLLNSCLVLGFSSNVPPSYTSLLCTSNPLLCAPGASSHS